MKSSMKDKVKGKFHELKGKVKQTTGHLCDNPKLESDGCREKIAGKIQSKVGQIEEVAGK
jgi:uncharacterized protein YjbJ (UPF0337 family)